MIYEDTRQQAGKHETKHKWWDAHGVDVERKKLDFGDYVSDSSNISVDTKRSISEVAMDVGRDHDRFVREMRRASDAGYRLVILIEVGNPYTRVSDVARWVSVACKSCAARRSGGCDPLTTRCRQHRFKPMQGPSVMRSMRTMEDHYGCHFELCRPSAAAKRICEILGVTYE